MLSLNDYNVEFNFVLSPWNKMENCKNRTASFRRVGLVCPVCFDHGKLTAFQAEMFISKAEAKCGDLSLTRHRYGLAFSEVLKGVLTHMREAHGFALMPDQE